MRRISTSMSKGQARGWDGAPAAQSPALFAEEDTKASADAEREREPVKRHE